MPSFKYQIIMKKIVWSVAVMPALLSWAHARNVKVNGETTCVGEAVSSRAISHGVVENGFDLPEADLAIMRRLDRLHLEFPFAGSRMLRGLLAAEGCKIGRRGM
jgi:hypothetical protein